MIYDHIKNIDLYKGLSPALDTALEFIAAARLPMDNGTTLLPHGVKAIVSEYVTKPVPELVEGPAEPPKQYEAHLKYADVQFLLAGSEHLRCCPLEYLTPATDYDEASDCRFYSDPSVISSAGAAGVEKSPGVALRLGSGYFAVVFPDDAHIPQLAVGEPEGVKKVVMKVPVG